MALENRILLRPDAPGYPAALRRCSDKGQSPAVTVQGNLDALARPLLGFFCSVRCPGDIILKTYDLTRALRSANVAIIGGFQSSMEKDCLPLLLRGTTPAVVCPARGLGRMRVPAEWKKPLADGQLLLLSFFDDSIRRATASIVARRNAYVAALADRILIAHAEKGGKIEELCKNALAGGKPVYTLDSLDNAHLIKLGAAPVHAADPEPLIAREFYSDLTAI